MTDSSSDKVFAGSIPKFYESHMVPLIFEPYAIDLVTRLLPHSPASVLEIAAGTGVVTRELAARLPTDTTIVASDLNPAMLEHAAQIGTARPVTWQQADAMALPFADNRFDAVLCQFGTMFFPDKVKAFAETRRVLRPGGVWLFSVWDRLEDNEFADTVTQTLAAVFPHNPPQFMARTPHGYHMQSVISRDLAMAGFETPAQISTLTAQSRAISSEVAAMAYCQGTPLRNEIEARDPARFGEAIERVSAAIAQRFGSSAVQGKIQALIVSVQR